MQPGLSLGDRYTVTELLGTGDHGSVYLGHDTVRDRPVRIKALAPAHGADPAARTRFRRIALEVATLDVPGVVDVIDCVEHRDGDTVTVCQIATAIDGVPLSRLLSDGLGLGTEEILSLVAAAAWAVHEAREAGVRHLNLKPANVIVNGGAVTVTDFGYLAVPPIGAYTAPELRDGAAPGDTADSYALGAIAYECLTGRQPAATDPLSTLPANTPPAVAAFLDRALSGDPRLRFPSAGALAGESEQINHTNDVLGALLARNRARGTGPGLTATTPPGPGVTGPHTGSGMEAVTGPHTGSGLDAATQPLNAAEVTPATTPRPAAGAKPSAGVPSAVPRTGSGLDAAAAPMSGAEAESSAAGAKPSAGAGPRTGSGLDAATVPLSAAGAGTPRAGFRSARHDPPRHAAGAKPAVRAGAGPRKHVEPKPAGRGRRIAVLVGIAVVVIAGIGFGIAALGPQDSATSAAEGDDPSKTAPAVTDSASDSTSPTPSASGRPGGDQIDGPSSTGSSESSDSGSSTSDKPDEPDDTDDEPDPPAKVKVPDVVGDARAEAVEALEDADLEVKVSKTGEGEYECPIDDQDPEAGKSVKKGTTVTIELRLAADAAGCGSDDGGDGGQTSPVTQDEAVARTGPAAARRSAPAPSA